MPIKLAVKIVQLKVYRTIASPMTLKEILEQLQNNTVVRNTVKNSDFLGGSLMPVMRIWRLSNQFHRHQAASLALLQHQHHHMFFN